VSKPSTDAELVQALEHRLSDLAARWRSRQDKPEANDIVRQYHAILHCMIELGYREGLDAETELPDELMPAEYLDLFRRP
jgi:hypothetical protein